MIKVLPFLGLMAGAILAADRDYGTVALPAALAAPGTRVEAVLNREPGGNAYLGFCEGPAVDAQGNIFFSSANRILRAAADGQGSVFDASARGTNGLEFDYQGRLVSCQRDRIVRYAADGSKETLPVSPGNTALGDLNDLSILPSGDMLLTNFDGGRVFHRTPAGGMQIASITTRPNGIEWGEGNLVYLCLRGLDKVVRFEYPPTGGPDLAAAAAKAVDFAAAVGGPDGITLDESGNVYVAANQIGQVKVFSPGGALLGTITVKSANPAQSGVVYNTTNCTFGGPGNRTLYITGNAGLYKVQLLAAGRRKPFSAGVRGRLSIPRRQASAGWTSYDLRGARIPQGRPYAFAWRYSAPTGVPSQRPPAE